MYGYQLYQAQADQTRSQIIAADARLGRQAAAVATGTRVLAGAMGTPGLMAAAAIRSLSGRRRGRPADSPADCLG
jgi:hypothetical protein